jgi:hypothetical protein
MFWCSLFCTCKIGGYLYSSVSFLTLSNFFSLMKRESSRSNLSLGSNAYRFLKCWKDFLFMLNPEKWDMLWLFIACSPPLGKSFLIEWSDFPSGDISGLRWSIINDYLPALNTEGGATQNILRCRWMKGDPIVRPSISLYKSWNIYVTPSF